MRSTIVKLNKVRQRRSWRVRKHVRGTALRPRLCVVKSNNNIHAQLIDDDNGQTLGAVGTFSKELRNTEHGKRNKASARKVGELIAQIAQSKNIKEVVFDRGPFKYHGILAELADAARAGGLKF